MILPAHRAAGPGVRGIAPIVSAVWASPAAAPARAAAIRKTVTGLMGVGIMNPDANGF